MSSDPPEAVAEAALHLAHEDPEALARRLDALRQEWAALRLRLRQVHGAILLLKAARTLAREEGRPCGR